MPDNQVATMLELQENADLTRELKEQRSFLDNMLLVYGTSASIPKQQQQSAPEDPDKTKEPHIDDTQMSAFSEEPTIEIANNIISKVWT